jgi:hypothetical protein
VRLGAILRRGVGDASICASQARPRAGRSGLYGIGRYRRCAARASAQLHGSHGEPAVVRPSSIGGTPSWPKQGHRGVRSAAATGRLSSGMLHPCFLSRVSGGRYRRRRVKEVDAGVDRGEAAPFVQVWPKFMVPRQIRLTVRHERPKCAYVISSLDDTPPPRRPPSRRRGGSRSLRLRTRSAANL